MRLMPALLIAAGAFAAPAAADEPARAVEDLVREHMQLWNAGDAAGISQRTFRLDNPSHPMATAEGLQRMFDDLKRQGYDHSTTQGIEGCLLSASQAIAVLRYSRIDADGKVMAPENRATVYQLRRTGEGWRVTSLTVMDPSVELSCKSMTAG